MQLVRIQSIQVYELQEMTLKVEAVCHKGTQNIQFSGLIDTQLKDAMEKVRSLIARYCKWQALDHIVVNLEPSWAMKRGTHHELAIFSVVALAIQRSQKCYAGNVNQRNQSNDDKDFEVLESPDALPTPPEVHEIPLPFLGSVDLEGNISHNEFTRKLLYSGKAFIGAHNYSHVSEIVQDMRTAEPISEFQRKASEQVVAVRKHKPKNENLITVSGRIEERFAILAAAIAELPVLLLGSPGVGKSHLAKWAVQSFPPPDPTDQKQIELYWSSAGLRYREDSVPHFAPHSRAHIADFIGKRSQGEFIPGYFSLCHQGVLILDEFPELSRDTREIMRIVLESKSVQTVSQRRHLQLDANFWLLATANPCACGKSTPQSRQFCECSLSQWRSYRQRFSGPLLDRFGVHLYLAPQNNTRFPSKEVERIALENLDASTSQIKEKISLLKSKMKRKTDSSPHIPKTHSRYSERQASHISKLKKSLMLLGASSADSAALAERWARKVEFHA